MPAAALADRPQRQALPPELAGEEALPDVLLPYQAELLAATAVSPLTVCEKSRRIGMTWGVGADAVLTAGAARSAGGMDVLYIGYNLDMAREFIDVCAMWARAFVPAAGDVQEFLFTEQGEDGADRFIQAFRIAFASGFEIVALTSKPRSLRGRQGYVIFDEAAFHDELGEMLKAALPLLMWGGKVLVISTHDGQDNPFNELVQEVRSGKRAGEVVRVTFDDAIAQGLYERIALVKGLDPTSEARQKWIATVRNAMGDAAGEELDCIPRAGSGTYLSGAAIEACMQSDFTIARLTCPDGFELRPMAERTAYVAAFLERDVAPALERLDPARLTALGEDFGRSVDLSVIAVGQEMADLSVAVPLLVEMANTPIEQQKQVVRFIAERLARFLGAHFDATGNGLALAEWAQEEFGHDRIEPVKITQAWYLEHGPLLKGHIEDQTIGLPRDSEIKSDLRAVRLINGVPSIPNARDGGRHGDAAVALMMLLAALKGEFEAYDYRPVKRGAQAGRPIRITAGFSARDGVW
ncbi:MAG: hypothetical protein QNJ16_15850 [Rhodobacter sp.]|nr:hypothetical protein [Rhodobacter sp.]